MSATTYDEVLAAYQAAKTEADRLAQLADNEPTPVRRRELEQRRDAARGLASDLWPLAGRVRELDRREARFRPMREAVVAAIEHLARDLEEAERAVADKAAGRLPAGHRDLRPLELRVEFIRQALVEAKHGEGGWTGIPSRTSDTLRAALAPWAGEVLTLDRLDAILAEIERRRAEVERQLGPTLGSASEAA